jgi:hypothetical protein
MKYSSASAFRQALERRFLERSRELGVSLVRLRKGVVFDRLLARLATDRAPVLIGPVGSLFSRP